MTGVTMSRGAVKGALPLPRAGVASRRLAEALAATLDLAASPPQIATLAGMAEHSPFLWRLATHDTGRLSRILRIGPEAALAAVLAGLDRSAAPDVGQMMADLRRARAEVALLVAFADLGGLWGVEKVTAALTAFADRAVALALRTALGDALERGQFGPAEPTLFETGCGLVVLALGKHGAGELNYSSDIDLTLFFDPERAPVAPGQEPQAVYVGVAKTLVRLLQERTADGYVFRVDLRLRPDPASTAVVVALPAALAYYETVGQNWERAALIKARPVAGDRAVGEALLGALQPFIWRKYFDYAAIADIHAMKRQIYAHKGHDVVAVEGHDVKLGRGGIREIEFFVQTQQLVFGGRRPQLRLPRTLDMLPALRADGWIGEDAVRDLSDAYRFLRAVEHRLQMVNDEQTQRLPTDPSGVDRFAGFMGLTPAAFRKRLVQHMRRVEAHYARLFEDAPGLSAGTGSLVFTGVTDDPETLETLGRLGFRRPEMVAEMVRGWHFGRRAAISSQRAREALTELLPALLEAFGRSGDPDGGLIAFDEALSRMPAVVELFIILRSNDALRALFAEIFGSAPLLAEVVAQRPHVLDAVIDPEFARPPTDAELDRRIRDRLRRQPGQEEFLDTARDLARAETFLVGARALSGIVPLERAGEHYAAIAAAVIGASLERVRSDLAQRHGLVPGAEAVVLGLGKLGGGEMTPNSDLDLIVVYDQPEIGEQSDGPVPLYGSEWFARMTQRLVSALTAPTRRGQLYQVDLRLRPSGSKGPVAVSLAAFRRYHAGEAETWEHMALCRARVVAGDPGLGRKVTASLRSILARPRDRGRVAADIRAMRTLVEAEKGDRGRFDLKLAPGGFVDIEFLVQFLQLVHAHRHRDALDQNTGGAIARLAAADLLPADAAETLMDAWRFYSRLAPLLALGTAAEAFDPATAPPQIGRRLAAAAELPDFRHLRRHLFETQDQVRELFGRIVA